MESVWDYPRPPRLEPCRRRVRIVLGGAVIADTRRGLRVLETSHPPGVYVPVADVVPGTLRRVAGPGTWCEFKGRARYYDLLAGGVVARAAAWGYDEPSPAYAALRGHVSVYPGRVSLCLLDDEEVRPQEGDFYGGWITSDVTGPFKGAPGTQGW
jgi:uncharacterized protein (DUF427 family)